MTFILFNLKFKIYFIIEFFIYDSNDICQINIVKRETAITTNRTTGNDLKGH